MLRTLSLVLLLALSARAQVIDTIAGNALNDNLAATSTTLVFPSSIVLDSQGNLYIADSGNFVVRKVDARTGLAAIVAGGGLIADGTFALRGTAAALDSPRNLVLDNDGNLFFIEFNRNRVRKLAPDGTLSTVFTVSGSCGMPVDGAPADGADLCDLFSLAIDRAGNLFLGSGGRIYRVDAATRNLLRLAGAADGRRGFSGDGGSARQALLDFVSGLVVDGQGNIFLGDGYNRRVRRVDAATGIITTVAGTGDSSSTGDGGPATAAGLGLVEGLALDAAGNLLMACSECSRVRRIDARTGVISTVAGGGSNLLGENVAALSAGFSDVVSVAVDANGNIYMADRVTGLVRRVDRATNLISTQAGTTSVGDGGRALSAPVLEPHHLARDSSDNLFFADAQQRRVRRIDKATGIISTVAGNGSCCFSGDGGPATEAQIERPDGIFFASNGDLLITDGYRCVVRRVRGGVINTVAGKQDCIFSGDGGQATAAGMNPAAVAANAAGTIFIADSGNSRIRAVNANGIISTLAMVGAPRGLTLDNSGNLLVADVATHTVLRVNTATGSVSTVAGNGTCGFSGDGGPATQAQLCNPLGLSMDSQGNIYVADSDNNRIRRIDLNGQITTFAGSGARGFSGDGNLATRASLIQPYGVVADSTGNVVLADTGNSRIRKVTLNQAPVVVLAAFPLSLDFTSAAGSQPATKTLTITNLNAGAMNWSAAVSTSSGGGWLSVQPSTGSVFAPTFTSNVTVAVNTSGLAAGKYQGTITIASAGAVGSPLTVPVTLTLGENALAQPGVSAQFLRFLAIQGDPAPTAQVLSINSPSSGTLTWSATAQTFDGGNWLVLSPASGTAPSNLTVSMNPAGLSPGSYLGLISVKNTASAEVFPVAVSLVLSAQVAVLAPNQTSFVFRAVTGATQLGPQTLRIHNSGRGTFNWTIQTIYPTGGNWLQVSPSSGSSGAGAPGSAVLTANPSGLSAGAYGAVLVVSSPGAENSPALVTVNLSVRSTGASLVADPAGMVFVAAGASGSQQQTLRISSSGGAALPFTVTARTNDGLNWVSVSPGNGQTPTTGAVIPITVTVTPGQLPAGIRQGTVSVTPQGGTALEVLITLVVTPGTGPTSKGVPVAAACSPARNVITPTGLIGNTFSVPAGWPATLLARVTDDCGTDVKTATVVASFNPTSPAVTLSSLGDGQYSGQWTPPTGVSAVGISLRAVAPPRPDATLTLSGNLGSDVAIPVLPENAAVNGASFAKLAAQGPAAPLAPGSIFSLFGLNLSAGTGGADRLPLPTNVLGSTIKIGGVDAPLFYVSPLQVNAQVPWELAGRSTASTVATANGVGSGTQTISLANLQPGIFSLASSGAGQGAILNLSGQVVDSSNPAQAGDIIQIYATGLGAVTPVVATGAPGPGAEPLARVNTAVTCRVGNGNGEVLFAGLAPNFVGLYQINCRVPFGGGTGSAVSVVLTLGNVNSNTVTIAVR